MAHAGSDDDVEETQEWLATLFREIGIYSPVGQLYDPEDAGSLFYYKEATDGQLLEEGITEAGALASWTAAATAYSVSGLSMLPFYIYYSMFGFQRVGDLIWAAADQRSREFLVGPPSRPGMPDGLPVTSGRLGHMVATLANRSSFSTRIVSRTGDQSLAGYK